MQFCFYPKHEHGCPHVSHCPHLGGAALGTLVSIANTSGVTIDGLHKAIDAERKRNTKLVEENLRLEKSPGTSQARIETRTPEQVRHQSAEGRRKLRHRRGHRRISRCGQAEETRRTRRPRACQRRRSCKDDSGGGLPTRHSDSKKSSSGTSAKRKPAFRPHSSATPRSASHRSASTFQPATAPPHDHRDQQHDPDGIKHPRANRIEINRHDRELDDMKGDKQPQHQSHRDRRVAESSFHRHLFFHRVKQYRPTPPNKTTPLKSSPSTANTRLWPDCIKPPIASPTPNSAIPRPP